MQLLPSIIAGMKAIEEAIPGQGKGEMKLAAIREILEKVSAQASGLWPLIEQVIGILTRLFNATGVFQTKAS
jgi:hypothetical protein